MPLLRRWASAVTGIMKRRAKLSLKRNNQKLKKPHIIDCTPEGHGYLNKSPHTMSGFAASLSAPSCQEAAEKRRDGDRSIGEASRSELAPVDHPNVRDNAFLEEATRDCEVGSLDHPTDPMSCESAGVWDVSIGSGHQMELERAVEECGDTDVAIPCSSVSCINSKEEFNSEEVDSITDPTPEIDPCTHYCDDDHSNPALYALSSDDMAQFEDFSMPHTQRTQSNPSIKRQTSLLLFMSKTSRLNSTSPSMNSVSKQQTVGQGTSSANSSIPTGKGKVTNRENSEAGTGSQISESSEGNGTKRICPFYKRIPGTRFSVDAFSYGTIPDCSAYFLSHFHADHYMGLTRRFQHPIYCSKITGNLVKRQLKVSEEHVHALDMNRPHMIEGVEVTLLDANHCPGSVLFLFKVASGRHYLHTGDFRYCAAMKQYPQLMNITVNQLFLDTTYCSPEYTFPRQDEVIAFAIDKAAAAIHSDPNTLIVCGTYTIGKERVFMGLAGTLGLKVFVSREKRVILECLESPEILSVLTADPCSAGLHVLPMGKLNMNDLAQYLEKWSSKFTSLLVFKPTGWTYSSKNVSLSAIKPQSRGSITIYGIPYSEHSSFSELCQFVQFLQPQKIIPTVNNYSAKKREEMQRHFKQWLTNPIQSPKTRQTTLDRTFRVKS